MQNNKEQKSIYSWEFEDNKNRGSMWYIIALSIVIGLSIWGVFTKQYGMSFIVLLIAGLFYFIENNSENKIMVKINKLGIKISGTFYDFNSIDSFGIVYSGENPILLRLNLNKRGLKSLDIKIDSSNISDIKNILSEFIEETSKIELSLGEKFTNLLKL